MLVTESQDLAREPDAEQISVKNGNGAVGAQLEISERNGANGSWSRKVSPTVAKYRLRDVAMESRGVQDYMERAPEYIKPDGGPPRWFCPVECGRPPEDAPLLLFLPGLDGTGLGLIRHYESLGQMFEVRCLHIPVLDRTPLKGLINIVENTVKVESGCAPLRPIYLVGDSLGGALALAVAARNPKVDLLLVLANPSTCFDSSQLQPFLPLMEVLPDELYQAVPFMLSFIMGDPIRMALATVERRSPILEKADALSENLVALLPTLPVLTDIIPKETLLWKLDLLKSTAMYANSRLHSVQAEVLVLASGKDQMLPSRAEAKRLQKTLRSCVVRYFKDSGHTLLLEEGINLGTIIRGAKFYRQWKTYDATSDFLYPTIKEFEEAYERNKLLRQLCSPVFFSKKEDGTVIRGLSGVPEDGPILLVGYHMLMGLELSVLISEFLKRKQLIRGVAHPLLFARGLEEGLTEPGFIDDVRVFGAVPASKKSFYKILSRRESALLYPGGAREALHRKGEAYKLFWPEHSEFVRTAARFGVTIVPFGVVGEDDLVELALDYNDIKKIPYVKTMFDDFNNKNVRLRKGETGEVAEQDLHMPLLVPKVPGRMYFLFGRPFLTAGQERQLQGKEEADRMYVEVKKEVEDCLEYLQKKREEDPYRGFFPRFLYESLWGGDWQVPTFKP